jgi:cellulose synthase/poly-beta-1,6-N-acetylglucosamine synthase-like glycosyltransferase
MIGQLVLGVIFSIMLFGIVTYAIDSSKKRIPSRYPFVSFILPVYNSGRHIEKTLRSIYGSYDKKKFKIIVIEDKSTDNTLKILKKLKNNFNFTLIENPVNLGKAESVNRSMKFAKGEIVFIVDSDVLLEKKCVDDLVARLENKKVAAASCMYKPSNAGFLARMQSIEYNMFRLVQGAYNLTSSIVLTGGCSAIKRDLFIKAGMFTKESIAEDMDLSLKLNSMGYKVQQSLIPVFSQVPNNIRSWYKQKMRWGAGQTQVFMKYYKCRFKNPVDLFLLITTGFLSAVFFWAIFMNLKVYYGIILSFFISVFTSTIYSWPSFIWTENRAFLAGFFAYAFIALPYLMMNQENRKKAHSVLYIFPFSWIYYPIYFLISVYGGAYGIYKFFKIKPGERGW